jgi:hypothetical protein
MQDTSPKPKGLAGGLVAKALKLVNDQDCPDCSQAAGKLPTPPGARLSKPQRPQPETGPSKLLALLDFCGRCG